MQFIFLFLICTLCVPFPTPSLESVHVRIKALCFHFSFAFGFVPFFAQNSYEDFQQVFLPLSLCLLFKELKNGKWGNGRENKPYDDGITHYVSSAFLQFQPAQPQHIFSVAPVSIISYACTIFYGYFIIILLHTFYTVQSIV